MVSFISCHLKTSIKYINYNNFCIIGLGGISNDIFNIFPLKRNNFVPRLISVFSVSLLLVLSIISLYSLKLLYLPHNPYASDTRYKKIFLYLYLSFKKIYPNLADKKSSIVFPNFYLLYHAVNPPYLISV